MTNKLKINITFYCILLLSVLSAVNVKAQVQDSRWSPPLRLSSDEANVLGIAPSSMVADQYGYVHVFWIEEDLNDYRSTIQYARFDGETWSTPLDIYVVQLGAGMIGQVSALVDQQGVLHLFWTEGNNGPVYYSSAPAHNALSAQHWSIPLLIDVPAYQIDPALNIEGVFHLLYSDFYGEQPGIYYVRSEDQGKTWTTPLWLDPDIPPDYAPRDIQLHMDDANGLHIVWLYVDLTTSGLPSDWIRYVRSLDGGKNWSAPMTIDIDEEKSGELRAAGPVSILHGLTINVIWAGDRETHREHRFSADAGQSWSVPVRIFGHLHGQAGDAIATDGAGRMHFLGQIRYPQGIYHAYWEQNQWIGPSLVYLIAWDAFDPFGDRIHAHRMSAAFRSGNQLVITFTNSPEEPQHALYTMHHTLDDIPPLTTLPTPTPQPTITPRSSPSPKSPSLAITPHQTQPNFANPIISITEEPSSPGFPFWLGLLPTTLLFVGVIIAFQLLRKR